ncbi:MAG: MFS transporter [Rhodobacteraceae bacterium]|nr:MFS transporter [Paracoccaceae bacterium]
MGRTVLALGVSQIVGYGSLYYAFPILVPHVAAAFGAAETVLYAVFSAGLLLGGLAAPLAGRLFDRHGAPRLMAAGSAAAGLILCGMAAAPSLAVYAAGVIAIELVAVAVLYDAAFAALALTEGDGARRAITRLTLIAGFASTIFWPLTGWLAGAAGWRATLLVYGALHLVVILPLHLWLARLRPAARRRPAADPGPLPPAPAGLPGRLVPAAAATVAASFALSAALISAFGVHMVPILAAAGLGASAPAAAMLMGPAQVAIRLVDALFWRALHPLTVAVVSALALPAGAAILLAGAPAALAAPAFAAVFGIGQGLASIVRGSVPLVLFGPAGYGERLGRLARVRTIVAAGAPFAFAALAAATQPRLALAAFAAVGLAAAVPLVLLRARLGREGLLAPLR